MGEGGRDREGQVGKALYVWDIESWAALFVDTPHYLRRCLDAHHLVDIILCLVLVGIRYQH